VGSRRANLKARPEDQQRDHHAGRAVQPWMAEPRAQHAEDHRQRAKHIRQIVAGVRGHRLRRDRARDAGLHAHDDELHHQRAERDVQRQRRGCGCALDELLDRVPAKEERGAAKQEGRRDGRQHLGPVVPVGVGFVGRPPGVYQRAEHEHVVGEVRARVPSVRQQRRGARGNARHELDGDEHEVHHQAE